jgi:SET domain-containing protein
VSSIHGQGLFAAGVISERTPIIEYVGQLIDKQESLRRCEGNNSFIFSVSEAWDLDGNVDYNLARLINHSCEPNCEAVLNEGRIWICATREIGAGEELTFNYGYELESYREHPCLCGTKLCAGFIVAEEFLGHVRMRRTDLG